MSLARLTLSDFRSYADLMIEPGAGFVVLTGENGAGKTNILEAVSLLAPGRGLRGAALSELARKDGMGGFTVNARLNDIELGTGTLASAPESRVVRINSATASATALSEWLSIVWLTPAQDRLFAGSPGERRRFLDRLALALDPAHAKHSTRYEAAMRQRNRLLADDSAPDPAWLDALEVAMEEHGDAIMAARLRTVLAICDAQTGVADEFPLFEMSLSNGLGARSLRTRLAAARKADAAAGRALVGPHTQDLEVRYAAKDQLAAQSSTGEQKALLLGIVLAHADLVAQARGRRPILLLDEVAAHLDPRRRAALFARLDASGGQVWMTGTEPALFVAVPATASRYVVGGGSVAPA